MITPKHWPDPFTQDRARIVCDCWMAKMIPPRRASANPAHVHEIPRPIIAAQASVPMVAVHMFRHRVLATSHPSTRPARCTGSTRSEFLSQPKREFGVYGGGDDGVFGWGQGKDRLVTSVPSSPSKPLKQRRYLQARTPRLDTFTFRVLLFLVV